MLTTQQVRSGVLVIHGVLALFLGLAFFYLRATMTNLLFEAVAVAIAILLSAAALILAAIVDWFAAFNAGMKRAHRFTFYLAGVTFALAGAFLGGYPLISMQWLVVFAAIHALAFGISAFVFAYKTSHHSWECRAMYFFGTISLLFSGTMAGLVRDLDDRSATALLGGYLCFVGTKMLFFAWDLHRVITITDRLLCGNSENTRGLPTAASPVNAIKH